MIQDPFRRDDPSIHHPDIYGFITDKLIDEVKSFSVLTEDDFFLLKLRKSIDPAKSMISGFELKNPKDNRSLILNSKKLSETGVKVKFQQRAYKESFGRKHYCHQVKGIKI